MRKLFVAGHRGMVGASIVRQLSSDPSVEVVTRSRAELDLTDQASVRQFFASNKFDGVILAAAHVGGILANNTYPGDFIANNLQIQLNVIQSANQSDIQRLLFLGSSCIYPKFAEQPINESLLMTGSLEPTNEQYAIAKIAGLKLCEGFNRQYGRDYRTVMPCNLYGPGDNYHPDNSHVLPALIRRVHYAKNEKAPSVTIWGSGRPRREFLFVDDMTKGALHVFDLPASVYNGAVSPNCSHINLGCGSDITIRELAELIKKVIGYEGGLDFDSSLPDGTPRKLMDSSLIKSLGWEPTLDLEDGIHLAYKDFLRGL
jgi:GDP-L-fucose synthase